LQKQSIGSEFRAATASVPYDDTCLLEQWLATLVSIISSQASKQLIYKYEQTITRLTIIFIWMGTGTRHVNLADPEPMQCPPSKFQTITATTSQVQSPFFTIYIFYTLHMDACTDVIDQIDGRRPAARTTPPPRTSTPRPASCGWTNGGWRGGGRRGAACLLCRRRRR